MKVPKAITIITSVIALGMTSAGPAQAQGFKNPPPPTPVRLALKDQSLAACHQAYPSSCTIDIYHAVYEQRAALWWNREWSHRDRTFTYGLRAASIQYDVSYTWMLACSRSEGGVWGWKWNHQGSGDGGWMQFDPGTFRSYAGYAQVERYLPPKYRSFYSRAGQAYVSAFMFSIGQWTQWEGAGCSK